MDKITYNIFKNSVKHLKGEEQARLIKTVERIDRMIEQDRITEARKNNVIKVDFGRKHD